MAIKVKHEMNAAPAAAATLAAGRARRSMETARMFASGSGSGGRGGGTTGAHASAISPGGAQAHVVGAHAPGVTDWEGTRRENAAQEEARRQQALDVAAANNEAARLRAEAGDRASMERVEARNAADLERQKQKELDEFNKRAQANGYSPNAQREIDAINEEYEKAVMSDNYSESDLAGLKEERDRRIAAIPKSRQKTPAEIFKERMVFGGGESGLPEGFVYDPQTGRPVVNPFEQQRIQADREMKQQEFQSKQLDRQETREQRKQEFQMKQIEAQMKRLDALRQRMDRFELEAGKPVKVSREVKDPISEAVSYQPVFEVPDTEAVQKRTQERFKAELDAAERQLAEMVARMQPAQSTAQPAAPTSLAPITPQPAIPQPAATPTAQPNPQPTSQPAGQPTTQAQPVIRQDSQGASWEIVFDANGKPIGKRRVRQ